MGVAQWASRMMKLSVEAHSEALTYEIDYIQKTRGQAESEESKDKEGSGWELSADCGEPSAPAQALILFCR